MHTLANTQRRHQMSIYLCRVLFEALEVAIGAWQYWLVNTDGVAPLILES